MGLLCVAAGAAAGAGADLAAARVAGQRPTPRTAAAASAVGALTAAAVAAHPAHTWHGWLAPLWAWGWLVAADVDLRARVVHDLHAAALAALALAAAGLDGQAVISIAGGLAVAGMLAALNWAAASGRRGAWPVAAAGAAGIVLAAAAWAMMARATAGLPVRGAGDPRVVLALLLAAAPPGLTVALRRMARGWDGEVVGWGDVMLAGVMGLWFGIRLVWAPLGIGIGAAAAMGAARWAAAAWARRRPPWLREAQPTVPGLLVGAVLGVVLATPS